MDSFDILVIILAISLAISILIWVWVGIICIKILNKVKQASDTALHAVENVEELTSQLKNAGKATAAGSVVAQISKLFKSRK